MEENIVKRKWYKKKRYIIPLGTFAVIMFGATLNTPDATPTSQIKGQNQNVQVQTASDQKVEIPGELDIQQNESAPAETNPYSSPYETPYNTPYITPYTTPPKKTQSDCDPNYSGCVPIASDVDCAGGQGDGPAYVSGPVNVIGIDKYGLDRDGDGVACE